MSSYVQAELSQARGRPDAVVHTEKVIYVIEFKLGQSAEEALAQIKAKGYAQPYLQSGKTVKAIGIRFSSERKQVDAWVEETLR